MSIYGSYLTEATKALKKDKYGNWLTGKSFKGVPVTIHVYKDKPTEDEVNEKYLPTLKDDLSILNANYSIILDEIAKKVKEYIENSGIDDKKYDSVDKCKKGIKLEVISYLESIKNFGEFNLVFSHPIPDKDGHSIFLDGVIINRDKKEIKIPSITFEG